MVRKYSIISMFSLIAAGLLCNPLSASAAAFGNTLTTAGDSFTVGTLTFQPSPQVIVVGDSDGNAFAVAAVHNGTFGKENGVVYLMSSDASGLFSTAAPDTATLPDVPGLPAKAEDGEIDAYTLEKTTTGT